MVLQLLRRWFFVGRCGSALLSKGVLRGGVYLCCMKNLVTDRLTNQVYFSGYLTAFVCWRDLKPALQRAEVPFRMIPFTRDIWVRDFMPIQISDQRMVAFRYAPSYLADSRRFQTDPRKCIEAMGLEVIESDLVVDGGNVVKCDDCVLMTNRVLRENRRWRKAEVIEKLERALDCEVVILPQDGAEEYGHADGMVRYVGNNTVLLNHYVDFDPWLRTRLLKVLQPRFRVVELHFDTARELATSWAYLNYMQVGERLFVPNYHSPLDEVAYLQLEEALGYPIEPIYCPTNVAMGGGLNCLSWTVREPVFL